MQISEAESVVMEILWKRGPCTAEEVIGELARDETPGWQEPTVKTLLNRLLNKSAIRAEKDGRRYRYWPELKRQDWVSSQSGNLLNRLFQGRVAPLVAHFSEHGKLSKKDVEELKKLIEGLDNER